MPKLVVTFAELSLPPELKRDHFLRGGAEIRRYVAAVRDGTVRVMVGKEPAGKLLADGSREQITHVSASVGRDSRLITHPFRRPTDDEMDAIKEGLFSLLKFEEDKSNDPCVRHLWEVQA